MRSVGFVTAARVRNAVRRFDEEGGEGEELKTRKESEMEERAGEMKKLCLCRR